MSKDYSKYCFSPINNKKLIDYYYKQRDSFWTFAEIKMDHNDRKDFLELNLGAQEFIKFVLAFFSQFDGIVNENLSINFMEKMSHIKEVNAFQFMQGAIEVIHNESYSKATETIIQDLDERKKILSAIENYPSIRKLAKWVEEGTSNSKSFLEQLLTMMCVEGIFFSSAFCSIYWIKKMNKMRGLCKLNEFIARDEALHTDFAIALYHHLTLVSKEMEPLDENVIVNIIKSAVEVNSEFIRDALKVELIGINSEDMIKYVKCTADTILESLGCSRIYKIDNPFEWMIMINLTNKTNFFEDTVSEYARPDTNEDFTFTTEEEF